MQRFPAGRHAERAAWKAGWWAYRHREDAAAVTYFEIGARNFPRSDYRPAWLYWSGKAKLRLGDAAAGRARLQLAVTDYRNSYYGRLAQTALGDDVVVPPLPEWAPPDASGLLPEQIPGEGQRLEPRDDNAWMVPDQPIDDDPANADAPGRPAMDEAADIG